MAEKIFSNDVGTRIEITLLENGSAVDISSATQTLFLIKRHDGTSVQKTANFVTDGTDGKLEYFIENDVLTVSGMYKIQAAVTLPTGTWHSDIKSFIVYTSINN